MPDEMNDMGERKAGKRFARGKTAALVALLVLAVAGWGAFFSLRVGGGSRDSHDHGKDGKTAQGRAVPAKAEKYTCGMHPFIISDKPGKCPICGMDLTKIEGGSAAGSGGGSAAKGERRILFYRNPMDPMVTSPVPAKDSMGMDYVPVYEDEAAGGAGGKAPEGYATVKVGAESLQVAGIQTAPAAREKISRQVRTVGNVVPDETRVRHVHTKIEGWIEKLHTNFTGQVVAKGQPLLSIYSPELLATQEEFLKSRETAAKFSASTSNDVRGLGEELLRSSRRRLELFDVPPSFIAELERTGKPRRTVTLIAPVSGYVTAKEVSEGQKVMPGMELFTVTDLSRVWIEADLYEYEARAVRLGQAAILYPAYDPGARLKGKVAYINPYLSPESRTLKVRFEFPNPGLNLKPQMFADVTLDMEPTTGVVIPDSALIDTGVRRMVFVDAGGGSFEPREVKVGVRGEGKAQILEGVREGERVAVRANFLLDSESRLRAALTKMTGGGTPPPQPQGRPLPQSQSSTRSSSQDHAGHGGGR
jgi:Cu(I)/Ag(I) efflux system membrane fusion protein